MPATQLANAENVGYAWVPLDLTGKTSVQAPEGAVIGGQERGKPTFVARVERGPGEWEVAKLNSWAKFGYGYFGKEVETSRGEVLVGTAGQTAVWMSSAFGEQVNGALSIWNGQDHEMVARTFYSDRWIPGKAISRYGLVYFPYGGKELQRRRHYQVLLGSLTWQNVAERLPKWLVPVDAFLPSCLENSISYADMSLQIDTPAHLRQIGQGMRLIQNTLDECQWVVSGDGIEVTNAVMVHHHQIGRKFIARHNQWFSGWVHPPPPIGRKKGGLYIKDAYFDTYEVLTANCKRMTKVSMQLAHGLSTDSEESLLTSPNEVFLVTRIAPGESAEKAYVEMLDSFQASKIVSSLESHQQQEASQEQMKVINSEHAGVDTQNPEESLQTERPPTPTQDDEEQVLCERVALNTSCSKLPVSVFESH